MAYRLFTALLGLSLVSLASDAQAVPVPIELLDIEHQEVTGPELTYMALAPDGNRLAAVRRTLTQTEASGELLILDTSAVNSASLINTIMLQPGIPFQPAYTPDGEFLLLAVSRSAGPFDSGGDNRVDMIDTATNTVVATLLITAPEEGPTGIVVTPDGTEAYVTIRGANEVQVIDIDTDPPTLGLGASVATDGQGVGIAITPDGTRVYVANRRTPASIDVIQTSNKQVVDNLPLPFATADTTSIAIAPDGSKAYATFFGENIEQIVVIDTNPASPTFHAISMIPTSVGSLREVSVTFDGRVLVASQADSSVLVIDAELDAELGSIAVDSSPYDAEAQQLPRAYAYVSADSIVDVIGLPRLPVEIDIKPGSDPNCFNPHGRGVITVALLGSLTFNVQDVEIASLDFEGLKVAEKGGQYLAHVEDANSDGHLDLVVQFDLRGDWVDPGTGFATVTGTVNGQDFAGTDTICVVP